MSSEGGEVKEIWVSRRKAEETEKFRSQQGENQASLKASRTRSYKVRVQQRVSMVKKPAG